MQAACIIIFITDSAQLPSSVQGCIIIFITDAGERAAEASGDDQARRRRDGSGDGDRDDAQANDDHTGIEQARGAQAVPRERLGPRTMGNDNPKLKQRGHDAIRDGEERYWKRISTP